MCYRNRNQEKRWTILRRRAKEVSESREKKVHSGFDKSCHLWCLWCSERHARWEKSQLKGRQWSMRGYLIRALRAVGINRDLKARTQTNHKLRGWLSISRGERRREDALSVGSECAEPWTWNNWPVIETAPNPLQIQYNQWWRGKKEH